MKEIEKGTIFRVVREIHVDFPCGPYRAHFVKKELLFQALEAPSNNGNFRARDSKNRLFWFNQLEALEIVK